MLNLKPKTTASHSSAPGLHKPLAAKLLEIAEHKKAYSLDSYTSFRCLAMMIERGDLDDVLGPQDPSIVTPEVIAEAVRVFGPGATVSMRQEDAVATTPELDSWSGRTVKITAPTVGAVVAALKALPSYKATP